jgi:hypothetical protein
MVMLHHSTAAMRPFFGQTATHLEQHMRQLGPIQKL